MAHTRSARIAGWQKVQGGCGDRQGGSWPHPGAHAKSEYASPAVRRSEPHLLQQRHLRGRRCGAQVALVRGGHRETHAVRATHHCSANKLQLHPRVPGPDVDVGAAALHASRRGISERVHQELGLLQADVLQRHGWCRLRPPQSPTRPVNGANQPMCPEGRSVRLFNAASMTR
jgi:hypothetical protein